MHPHIMVCLVPNHATGKGYFAHGGNWIKLLDETQRNYR